MMEKSKVIYRVSYKSLKKYFYDYFRIRLFYIPWIITLKRLKIPLIFWLGIFITILIPIEYLDLYQKIGIIVGLFIFLYIFQIYEKDLLKSIQLIKQLVNDSDLCRLNYYQKNPKVTKKDIEFTKSVYLPFEKFDKKFRKYGSPPGLYPQQFQVLAIAANKPYVDTSIHYDISWFKDAGSVWRALKYISNKKVMVGPIRVVPLLKEEKDKYYYVPWKFKLVGFNKKNLKEIEELWFQEILNYNKVRREIENNLNSLWELMLKYEYLTLKKRNIFNELFKKSLHINNV